MKTLWINVLGFSSGRTGWVMTDGGPPYQPGTKIPAGEAGVCCRFEEEGALELLDKAREAEAIKILTYGSSEEHNDLTLQQIEEALDPYGLVNDRLSCLRPDAY